MSSIQTAVEIDVDTERTCPDCAVPVGHAHVPGCDVARCLRSGGQRLSCPGAGYPDVHDCGEQTWTGMWPGEAECHEFGWYSYFQPSPAPPGSQTGWISCGPEHPGASADLNRLHTDAHWNPAAARWERGACDHRYRTFDVTDEHGQPDQLRECTRCGALGTRLLSLLAAFTIDPAGD